jgi:hypothetical protein
MVSVLVLVFGVSSLGFGWNADKALDVWWA